MFFSACTVWKIVCRGDHNSRPANTKKNIFLRHGGVVEGTQARSITNRIRNNVWVDATVTFDFEGHFKGHTMGIYHHILFIIGIKVQYFEQLYL